MRSQLPEPRLTLVYRLEAHARPTAGPGRRSPAGIDASWSSPGGRSRVPKINGKLLPGASADWQIVLADGTALGAHPVHTGDRRSRSLLYVRLRGVRHGSPEVLARLGRGEDVEASEYTFRTSTQIETAAPCGARLDEQGCVHRRRRTRNPPA